MLNGLLDIGNRLDYLTENGDMLPTLKKTVPWNEFRSDLEFIYAHERKRSVMLRQRKMMPLLSFTRYPHLSDEDVYAITPIHDLAELLKEGYALCLVWQPEFNGNPVPLEMLRGIWHKPDGGEQNATLYFMQDRALRQGLRHGGSVPVEGRM